QNSTRECAKIKRIVSSRSSSTSMMNDDAPYISSNTDKYNINNILIPSELISNQKISCMPAHKISTPGWRIVELEPLCDGPKPDEELDDTSILDRHKIIEMKEKINFSNIKNSLDTPLKDSESTLPSNGSNRNLEWPVRNFPLSDQDYKAMIDER
ncbi:KAT8 regulatory NSL complex subunit 1 isoform X3, partial [Brachionus plicatilis]